MNKTTTCTDCNKTFKTLFSYKTHRTKFHKVILKASVVKGKILGGPNYPPVYPKDLCPSEQSNQSLGYRSPTNPGTLNGLQLSDSPSNLIEQQRKDLISREQSELDDLILKKVWK